MGKNVTEKKRDRLNLICSQKKKSRQGRAQKDKNRDKNKRIVRKQKQRSLLNIAKEEWPAKMSKNENSQLKLRYKHRQKQKVKAHSAIFFIFCFEQEKNMKTDMQNCQCLERVYEEHVLDSKRVSSLVSQPPAVVKVWGSNSHQEYLIIMTTKEYLI